ncbi:hypothetical protein VNO78_34380 [Psophocarpus tetragonolobus]|uniref:Uncharacterized protein n=1 Tax=Psophocarpus tetragonolobus TaxID=3891 RepID=A0AAN9NV49_PSOTE
MPWISLLHHHNLFFLSLSENPNSESSFAPLSLSAFSFHMRIRCVGLLFVLDSLLCGLIESFGNWGVEKKTLSCVASVDRIQIKHKLVLMNGIVCSAFRLELDLLFSFFIFRNRSVGMEEFYVGFESMLFFSWRVLNNKKWCSLDSL